MRLNEKYLYQAYANAAIKQKEEELKNEGYTICSCKEFDLLAEKDDKRKAFEFKFRGGSSEPNKIMQFIETAEKINADPIVIYMSVPGEDTIEFDDLGEFLQEYLVDNFPDSLDELSTHTRIEEVYIERILSIRLEEKCIMVEGEASLGVELQWGSDRENEDDNMYMTFPMEFKAEFTWEREIVDVDYCINTESFYG